MKITLVQLPVPKLNFGMNTGNIPLGPACLAQAAADLPGVQIEILPRDLLSHAGDQAIVEAVAEGSPDLVGFTVFCWNRGRSLYLAEKIKAATRARILFGGPEITEDTSQTFPDIVDLCVMGEGEELFRQVITHPEIWKKRRIRQTPACSQLALGSPYLSGHLPIGRDGVMLLETQRGCPYRCGFCYYSKSRKKRDVAPDALVLDGLAWALDNGVREIYLMDPSLNARPGLDGLLEKTAAMNKARIPMTSEIRAESVTPDMAERYARAGFTTFEVGLQSTNPAALDAMNRPTRLDKFLDGIRALQDAGIAPTIDLIFGLPGDTPDGFRKSVDFLLENGMDEHVQVFPLLVLPGTAFRKTHQDLGLVFSPHPPYPVIRTPGFSEEDLGEALDYAEEAFDRALYPFPDLDLAHPSGGEHFVTLADVPCLAKLVLDAPRPPEEIRHLAGRITAPFQIFLKGEAADPGYARQVVEIIASANPFVPLEIVFIEPDQLPDSDALLAAAAPPDPHFLDLDLRWLYPEPGNRSLMVSLVSDRQDLFFQGPMKRQIFHWTYDQMPGIQALNELSYLDGILVDTDGDRDGTRERIVQWQDYMAGYHEDFVAISFSDIRLHLRWLSLTEKNKYDTRIMSGAEPLS